MSVTVRSFAKVNLGLRIGAVRPDGFHELRTVYQTIGLHDIIRVEIERGSGIEIRCDDPRVPKDGSNTCHQMAQRGMAALKACGRVVITIEKDLPVQGGLGGASANAVATLLALERAAKQELPGAERLRIAAEVGSDLPLFLIGGTVLGVGRGEEVYPLPDLPATACVVATPEIGISTPEAFADWDRLTSPQGLKPQALDEASGTSEAVPSIEKRRAKLTDPNSFDRMAEFSRDVSAWLSGRPQGKIRAGKALSGVPASGRGRAGNPLLDLVRTGIENDFEQVVFPQYPELEEVKRVLVRTGAMYASLSGSGSAIYGLFVSRAAAERAASRVRQRDVPALVTTTLTRRQYWKRIAVGRF